MNRFIDFIETCTYTYLGHQKKLLDFGDIYLIFKVRGSNITLRKKACLYSIVSTKWPDFDENDTDTSLGKQTRFR